MLNYSKVFKHIKPEVVEAFQMLMPDIWHSDTTTQTNMMREWLSKASEVYGLETPDFEFRPDDEVGYAATGGGCYSSEFNKITMFFKVSVVTLAHEFRHMMQEKKEGLEMFKEDKEHDARAWSVSLFRKSNPGAYRRAVRRGLLHFE